MTDDPDNIITLPRKRPTSGTRRGNGAGKGDGWGGPASGSKRTENRPAFTKADGVADPRMGMSPAEIKGRHSEKVRSKTERVQALEDKLFDLSMGAEREETQVQAASKLHAIYEGSPTQKVITTQVDDVSRLNDDELQSELARLARAEADLGAGDAPKGLPN